MDTQDALIDTEAAWRYLTARGAPTAEKTLVQLRWKGSGPMYYRIGNRVRYKRADLDAWIESHRCATSADWRKP